MASKDITSKGKIMFKKSFACGMIVLAASSAVRATVTADFEDLAFSNGSSSENGINLNGSFTSNGLSFGNLYDSNFQFWSGFAYSKVKDSVTSGFGNQYAAVPG